MNFLIYCDGGCPNNGRGGQEMFGSFAVYALEDGYRKDIHDELFLQEPKHFCERMQIPTVNKYCGATNNIAEASTLHAAISYAKSHGLLSPGNTVHICMDSELIINQITGVYKTKQPYLKHIYDQIRMMLKDHSDSIGMPAAKLIHFHWISGETMKKTILQH